MRPDLIIAEMENKRKVVYLMIMAHKSTFVLKWIELCT